MRQSGPAFPWAGLPSFLLESGILHVKEHFPIVLPFSIMLLLSLVFSSAEQFREVHVFLGK